MVGRTTLRRTVTGRKAQTRVRSRTTESGERYQRRSRIKWQSRRQVRNLCVIQSPRLYFGGHNATAIQKSPDRSPRRVVGPHAMQAIDARSMRRAFRVALKVLGSAGRPFLSRSTRFGPVGPYRPGTFFLNLRCGGVIFQSVCPFPGGRPSGSRAASLVQVRASLWTPW